MREGKAHIDSGYKAYAHIDSGYKAYKGLPFREESKKRGRSTYLLEEMPPYEPRKATALLGNGIGGWKWQKRRHWIQARPNATSGIESLNSKASFRIRSKGMLSCSRMPSWSICSSCLDYGLLLVVKLINNKHRRNKTIHYFALLDFDDGCPNSIYAISTPKSSSRRSVLQQ